MALVNLQDSRCISDTQQIVEEYNNDVVSPRRILILYSQGNTKCLLMYCRFSQGLPTSTIVGQKLPQLTPQQNHLKLLETSTARTYPRKIYTESGLLF
jgi:hypothetical protein